MLIPMSIVMEPDELLPFNEVIWHTYEDDESVEDSSFGDDLLHEGGEQNSGDPEHDPEVPTPPVPHPGPPEPGDPVGNPPSPGDPPPQSPSPGGPGPVNPSVSEPKAY